VTGLISAPLFKPAATRWQHANFEASTECFGQRGLSFDTDELMVSCSAPQ